jgi:predicted nucleotidyltransferase
VTLDEKLEIPADKIADFCRRWQVTELALFGSVLRDDFAPDSDMDVLISFAQDAPWNLFDLVKMEDELSPLLERQVDLVERRAIERSENYIRRRHILNSAETIYVA